MRACGEYVRRACPTGCGSTADCTALWLEAAERDPEDALESCIATCPRTTCAADVFFDCTCYGECLGRASSQLQEAVLAATRCDLGGVPASCL